MAQQAMIIVVERLATSNLRLTKLNITVFIPLYSFDIDVTEDYLICETVIVGDVPESYTHVVSEDKDIIDSINDFEAEPYD